MPIGGYGWTGRHICIDLTRGDITVKPNDLEIMTKYLGARGVGIKTLMDGIDPTIAANDPINRMVIATGPLTGIPFAGNRCYYTTKSPSSGGVASVGIGGSFGSELKFAGYDYIVIHGKSARPNYLWINDGDIRLHNADHLWELDTRLTEKALFKETHPHAQATTIEPGVESAIRSLVNSSEGIQEPYIQNRRDVASIMGIKNLKAVVVRGTQGVKIADPSAFKEKMEQFFTHPLYMRNHGATGKTIFKSAKIRGTTKRKSCFACPLGSKPVMRLGGAQKEHPVGIATSDHDEEFYKAAFDCSGAAEIVLSPNSKFEKDDGYVSNQNIAAMIKSEQDYRAWAYDALGCCFFLLMNYTAPVIAAILECVTGISFGTKEDLDLIGERIFTLERIFNLHAGLLANYNTLPKASLKKHLSEGIFSVHHLNHNALIPDYFKIRGWDKNGFPEKEKLELLGLTYP